MHGINIEKRSPVHTDWDSLKFAVCFFHTANFYLKPFITIRIHEI